MLPGISIVVITASETSCHSTPIYISATRVLLHPERHSIDTRPSHSEAVRDKEARHVVHVDNYRSEIPYTSQNVRNQRGAQHSLINM